MIKIINHNELYPKELISFFNENKEYIQKKYSLFNDAFLDLNCSYFQINFDFDHEIFLKECKKINHLFVKHRQNDINTGYAHKGWSAITLHGIDSSKTQHYSEYGYNNLIEANYRWTDICQEVPNIFNFLNQLPYDFFDRVRIMKLAPHGYIMPHSDNKDRTFGPLNISINNPKKCYFVFEKNGIVPFSEKNGFILDVSKKHMVINMSNETRYHIIIHGNYKKELFLK